MDCTLLPSGSVTDIGSFVGSRTHHCNNEATGNALWRARNSYTKPLVPTIQNLPTVDETQVSNTQEFDISKITSRNVNKSSSPPIAQKYQFVVNTLAKGVHIDMGTIRKWAVLDSGATGNFPMTNVHAYAVEPTKEPISVTLPDGNKVQSTHQCVLDLPQLPTEARKGHNIPGLTSNSLMSVVVLGNVGCKVIFKTSDVTIRYKGEIVLQGSKCDRTHLWVVPLKNTQEPAEKIQTISFFPFSKITFFGNRTTIATRITTTPATNQCIGDVPTKVQDVDLKSSTEESKILHKAANVAIMLDTSIKQELAKFHHQALGSPPTLAISRVLNQHPDELLTFPGMNRRLINKHLPSSTATAKYHMTRSRKELRPTKKNDQQDDARAEIEDMAPTEQVCTAADNEMFCYLVTTNYDGNVVYSNLAGRFPIESYAGMNYFFVCYVYKCNYVMLQTMKSRKDEDMVATFKGIYGELNAKGHRPALHVLDNECSKAVK